MVDVIEGVEKPEKVPIIQHLLNPMASSKLMKTVDDYVSYFEAHYKVGAHPLRVNTVNVFERVAVIIQNYVTKYTLNIEQAQILWSIVLSVTGRYLDVYNSINVNPISLIHGPFGTGKSFLVSVLVVCLDEIASTFPNIFGGSESMDHTQQSSVEDDSRENYSLETVPLPRLRVLITSMTNVAIDNVLKALLKLDYNIFQRVGSLKRIAKPILPYASRSEQSEAEDIKELEAMLKSTKDEKEREFIEQTIFQMHEQSDINKLDEAFAVGCTCLASSLTAIRGQAFPLIIIDEACQVPEPMVMGPLLRFQCRQLVLIGDPLQLPPTLTTLAAKKAEGKGLDRTLFDRMRQMGFRPFPLKIQYRVSTVIMTLCIYGDV